MTKPTFPHTIDSTILSTFRSCPQKFYLQYLCHWKPRNESVHLRAGGAFAAGIEAARKAFFIEGLPSGEAEAAGLVALIHHYGDFECPPESAKSLERTCGALEFYFTNYPLGEDGTSPIRFGIQHTGIELSFAEPVDYLHPTSGDPLLYTGRSDMVAEFAGGTYIFDEKTTSQLGQSWGRQWELRSQFTGYTWALEKSHGILASGTIIRGVSILKTKYDTQQIITNRAPWEVARWEEQLLKDLARMERCWQEDYWDYCLDHACNDYGGCAFSRICKMEDPLPWLEADFERKVWDPLCRKLVTPEEYEAQWEPADGKAEEIAVASSPEL